MHHASSVRASSVATQRRTSSVYVAQQTINATATVATMMPSVPRKKPARPSAMAQPAMMYACAQQGQQPQQRTQPHTHARAHALQCGLKREWLALVAWQNTSTSTRVLETNTWLDTSAKETAAGHQQPTALHCTAQYYAVSTGACMHACSRDGWMDGWMDGRMAPSE